MTKIEQQHITEAGAFNTFPDLITVAASGLRPDRVSFDTVPASGQADAVRFRGLEKDKDKRGSNCRRTVTPFMQKALCDANHTGLYY